MEFMKSKSFIVTLIIWNGLVYITIPLVYVFYFVIPVQVAAGWFACKFLNKEHIRSMLMSFMVVIPTVIAAPFIPDTTNGLVISYAWSSSVVFVSGVLMRLGFLSIKSLTIRLSRDAKKRRAP